MGKRVKINQDELENVAGGDFQWSFDGPTGIGTITSDEQSAAGLTYVTLPGQASNAYNCINNKSLDYMTDKERFDYMVTNGMIVLKN